MKARTDRHIWPLLKLLTELKHFFSSGLEGSLKDDYAAGTLSVEDVTGLAHKVGYAHSSKQSSEAMTKLLPELPDERPYTVKCKDGVLYNLGMLTVESF